MPNPVLKIKSNPELFKRFQDLGDKLKQGMMLASSIVQNDIEITMEDAASWYEEVVGLIDSAQKESRDLVDEVSMKLLESAQQVETGSEE